MKTFCFDLDGIICKTTKNLYKKSIPKKDTIKLINKLYRKNYIIKKYSETKYDQGLHHHLADEIAEQDSHRTLKLPDVDAFLHSWING